MNTSQNGYVSNRVLKFQIGFLLSEGRGNSSDTELNIPRLRVAEDMTLDYIRGTIRFSRTSRGILVQGKLRTSVAAECNRCLTETYVDLEVPIEELFVYPPEPDAEFIVAEDGILDLAPLLREEIILDTPIGILCQPDCKGLCPECGKNHNDGPCDCAENAIDPRFAALRALKAGLDADHEPTEPRLAQTRKNT